MERMTQDGVDVCRDLCMDYDECTSTKLNPPIICLKAATYNKLRAYEVTGLEPEEIVRQSEKLKLIDFNQRIKSDRLAEIVKAEYEGRLIVLPCKEGESVFRIQTIVGVDVNGEYAIVENPGVQKTKFDLSLLREWGRRVFLTREKAKAALKEGTE